MADDDTTGPGPGEKAQVDEKIDEANRGDKVSDEVAAMPEPDTTEAKTAAQVGADVIEKAEKAVETPPVADVEEKPEEKLKATAPSGLRVPKHRLDAVQAARRAAEARATQAEAALEEMQALQAQAQAAPVTAPLVPATPLTEQIEAFDKTIDDFIEEGKTDEAREARREQRTLERQQMREESQAEAKTIATESVQQTDLRMAIENVEDAIPALNPDDETYDETLSTSVNELADAFEAQGYTPANAIYKALEYAMPATADEETMDEATADPQVEKNIDAATRTPANLSDASKTAVDSDKAGLRSGKIDVMDMSEKRFDEFVSNEEQERIARGDFLGT